MKHRFHIRFTWILTLVGIALLTLPFTAFADDISNNLDAVAEVMPLTLGGPNGTTQLYVVPRNGDGKPGCNLTGGTTLVVSVSSDNPAVATVSPSSVTFGSCGDTPTLTVTPVGLGSTTISLSQISNSTGGTFNLVPATFIVNVVPPPNTPPNVTVIGIAGGASYPKGAVPTAICQITDAEDGNSSFPATLSAVTGPYAVDGIGEQTASCSYTDAGGLTAADSLIYGIFDPSPPLISYVLNPASPDGSNGWYRSAVSLVWTVDELDSPSSLSKTGCDNQNIITDQAEMIHECAASSAGGSAGPVSISIKRDGTPPTISGSASPDPNINGWNNNDVTVSFSCGDNLSGVAICGPNQILSSEGAGQAVAGTATDEAGNTASSMITNINIDKTPPSVDIIGVTNGAAYILGSVPVVSCATQDTLSGVATNASLSVSGGPVGPVTATCSGAVDNAGNPGGSVSAVYNVIYAWAGFFQPVDNLPTLNMTKAGSAIPVKFSLGGNWGLNIFWQSFPVSRPINCDGSMPSTQIEETVTAGNSSLNYDASTNQYIYVWKTDKGWAGACRQLVVKLVDGTEHAANFKFAK
ncbi:MAG: hypothetical protein DCC55_13485 [Chloroflexi bacterium]|nr:MAG: hypothetical protein DCC55_13485 [Chloroflexota bacterium]